MSDNKKYYYLKLKDNFFDSDEMIILETMQDGYLYSNILLKLYLRSLKYNGRLMFNDRIPFNANMLSTVTRHSVGVVEKAMKIFQDLGLIDVLDNGAIYMSDIQNFIGESSTEADRKREYRLKVEAEKLQITGQTSGQMSDKYPPEIEKELDTELKKKKKKDNSRFTPPTIEQLKEYCIERKNQVDAQRFIDFYESKGWLIGKNKMKDWKAAVRTWESKDKVVSKGGTNFSEVIARNQNRTYTPEENDDII